MNFHFWIVTDRENKLVGIDPQSGGYPYSSSHLSNAKLWDSKEEAEEYISHFGEDTSYRRGYVVRELYARVE